MSIAINTAIPANEAHQAFDAALGRIDAVLRHQFRAWPPARRRDAIDDARAYTWLAWHGLLARGKDPIAVGITAIARNACRAVRNGRTVGSARSVGRSAMDIHHPRARHATGIRVVSLEGLGGGPPGRWQDWLAAGDRYGPADEAAFRIDFAAWLAGLPPTRRRVADLLSQGLGTGEVACRLGVTSSAVSQSRDWLARSWGRFQGRDDAGG
jgi:DNA-directed RNA polymerase specialized sigma24 family protein